MSKWNLILVLVLLPLFTTPLPPPSLCCGGSSGIDSLGSISDGYDTPQIDPEASSWEDLDPESVVERLPAENPCCDSHKSLRGGNLQESRRENPRIRTKRFPAHLDPLYHYRFLARSGQCPTAEDGQPEFYCPTPDYRGNWRCIDDFHLCNGKKDCPNGEDELPIPCLFFRVVETHVNSLRRRISTDESRAAVL